MNQIILPRNRENAGKAARFIEALPLDRAWAVEVKEHKPRRSDEQNRYLWSIYQHILKVGGEDMGGWTKEDLHDFFLITHFGSEIKELFGRKRHVPLRRSSKLNKQEFTDFIETIFRFMAERGVYIPSSDEFLAGAAA